MSYDKVKLEQLLTALVESKSKEDSFLDQLRKYNLDEFLFENDYSVTYNKQIDLLLTYAFDENSFNEIIWFLFDPKPLKWYVDGTEYEINTVSDFMFYIDKSELEIEFNKEISLDQIKSDLIELINERTLIGDELNEISKVVCNCIINNEYIRALEKQLTALMKYCFDKETAALIVLSEINTLLDSLTIKKDEDSINQ